MRLLRPPGKHIFLRKPVGKVRGRQRTSTVAGKLRSHIRRISTTGEPLVQYARQLIREGKLAADSPTFGPLLASRVNLRPRCPGASRRSFQVRAFRVIFFRMGRHGLFLAAIKRVVANRETFIRSRHCRPDQPLSTGTGRKYAD